MFELGLLPLDVKRASRRCTGRSPRNCRASSGTWIRKRCPRICARSTSSWPTSTSATSPSSSRCSTTGRSGSSSRSCRSTASTKPQLESTLVDITCDSDGKVSKYIDLNDVRETLPLHELRDGEPYYLGIFLTGAYQDIMGDIHNLFGRVNEVHVFLDADEESGFYIEEEIPGQTIGEVLAMTQYDWRDLEKRMKAQIDAAIKQDIVRPNEGRACACCRSSSAD